MSEIAKLTREVVETLRNKRFAITADEYQALCDLALLGLDGARDAGVEEAARVCDALYHAKKVICAWDEGEGTGYQEAATAIRALKGKDGRVGGVQTLDLDAESWKSIKEAANKSSWIPPEYYMNDWVSDVCAFLHDGDKSALAPDWVKEIDALAEKATKGPWSWRSRTVVAEISAGKFSVADFHRGNPGYGWPTDEQSDANAGLATALVNAWPSIRASLSPQAHEDGREWKGKLESLANGLQNCIGNAKLRKDAYDVGYMEAMLKEVNELSAMPIREGGKGEG